MIQLTNTELYKFALENQNIFPPREYKLEEIYKRIEDYVYIPPEHWEVRPDTETVVRWKNYIHTVRPNIERIEYLGNQTYRFK